MRYWGGWADGKLEGKTIESDPPYRVKSYIEPLGVVGAIIPWNFPLETLSWKLRPALCAANTIVIKPSDRTALSALKLASLTQEAGFPRGVINVVPGFGNVCGNAIVNHMDVAKIAFTGSTPVGKKIAATAANSNLKRVSLELGGKSPVIILPDIYVKKAASGAFWAITYNAGQICVAGSRTFVHEIIYEEFIAAVIQEASHKKLSYEAPDDQNALQPLIDEGQVKRVLNYIDKGKQEGAKLLYGGNARVFQNFSLPKTQVNMFLVTAPLKHITAALLTMHTAIHNSLWRA